MRFITIRMIIFEPMKSALISLFLLSFLLSSGQPAADSLRVGEKASGIDADALEASITKRRLRFSVEFGTAFGASRYGSSFGTYVAPHFSYPLSKRFTISAGAYIAGVSPISQIEPVTMNRYPYSPLYPRSLIYAEGSYQLTNNLIVSGTVYREVNAFNQNPAYPGYNNGLRGVIMGVDYKISDHAFIRGEIEFSNGRRSYFNDPFMNPASSRMFDPFFYHP